MYCVTLWVCRKAAQRFSFSLLSNLEKRFEKKLKMEGHTMQWCTEEQTSALKMSAKVKETLFTGKSDYHQRFHRYF